MSKRFIDSALFGLLHFVLLILLISGAGTPSLAQTKPQVDLTGKNVLILHAFERTTPANERTDQGLRDSFESGGMGTKNQFFEYLDLLPNPGPEYRKRLAELLRLHYSQRKIDMIITLYNEALQFLLNEGRDIFPDVPVLALYMSPGIELPKTNRRIIEHQVTYDMLGTLEAALKLVPRAKRVYLVSGVYYSDKRLQNQARRDLKKWEASLEFQYLSDMSLEQMLTEVSNVPPGSIIMYLSVLVDRAGKTYTARNALQQISRVSQAPVFGLYDILLGHGIAGGSLVSFQLIGTRAGELALDILRGIKTPDSIPAVLDVPAVPMFDWRQLRRWNLSEGALPKGSTVINREVTFWDFKYYIIGALVLCLAETALIIFLIVQRRRKKVAEEELAAAKQRLEAHLDNSPLAVVEFDSQFRVIRWSREAERLFGWTAPEVMGRPIAELRWVHKDDVESVRQVSADMLSGNRPSNLNVNRNYRKDGSVVLCEWYNSAIFDAQGRVTSVLSRILDVTERKLAQQALVERLRFERFLSNLSARFVNIPSDRVDSEIEAGLRQIIEFFQVDRCALLQTLPDKTSWQITHVASSDDVPPVPQGTKLPVSINPWAYDKLIRKREVLSVSRLDDLPAEANVDKQTWIEWGIRSNLNIPIMTGESNDYIIAVNSVKSERVWPEELFPRLRLVGEVFVNGLERKQIRLEIEERLRFEGLISNLSAGFVNLPSGEAGEVESQINNGLRSITEFFNADRCSIGLFSKDGTQLVRAFEYRSAEAEPALESMSKKQMPWYMEQLIRGNPVVINRVEDLPPEAEKERRLCLAKGMKSVLSIPMLSGGKTLGSCALVSTRAERIWPEEFIPRLRLLAEILVNVTEHKRAEGEVNRARTQLLHVERSARMGELTASLAHELNQPLAAILSNAQAALRFLQSDEVNLDELREILHDIIQDDQRAGNVIRSLRSMMKREERERNPIILNTVLNDVTQIFHTESIFRNMHIDTEFDESLPLVLADKVQLQQVVLNLIVNAADAMSQNSPEQRRIIMGTQVKNDRIRVTIRDFGPGIDQGSLDRIFQPFFTTKGTGLGMGLAVSQTIVEAHGGHIWAENNPDGGATFFIELPVVSDQ